MNAKPHLLTIAGAWATATLVTFAMNAIAETPTTLLFKIVTVRDEVIVAVPVEEVGAPRPEVAAIGEALAAKGALTLRQYTTRKGADGALEWAPRSTISVLLHDSLRVEPYTPAVRVMPVQ